VFFLHFDHRALEINQRATKRQVLLWNKVLFSVKQRNN